MPLRPDLPSGLNLTRRATTPVKLPKMNFPMLGGVPESTGAAPEQAPPAPAQPAPVQTAPQHEEENAMEENRYSHMTATMAPTAPMAPPQPVIPQQEGARVIVYGRSGSQACIDAIQDLLARGICFTYHDVTRDQKASQHMQAIVGNNTQVPVIIHIGVGGS